MVLFASELFEPNLMFHNRSGCVKFCESLPTCSVMGVKLSTHDSWINVRQDISISRDWAVFPRRQYQKAVQSRETKASSKFENSVKLLTLIAALNENYYKSNFDKKESKRKNKDVRLPARFVNLRSPIKERDEAYSNFPDYCFNVISACRTEKSKNCEESKQGSREGFQTYSSSFFSSRGENWLCETSPRLPCVTNPSRTLLLLQVSYSRPGVG